MSSDEDLPVEAIPIHRLQIKVNAKEESPTNTLMASTLMNSEDQKLCGMITPSENSTRSKSKTLPANYSGSPCLIRLTPKVSIGHDSPSSASQLVIPLTTKSPRKSLNFIRRSHSTKLSRNSSILQTFSSKTPPGNHDGSPVTIELRADILEKLHKQSPQDFNANLKRILFCRGQEGAFSGSSSLKRTTQGDTLDDDAFNSDTSYEKACRRGSAPSTPNLEQEAPALSRFTHFFSKRSFRTNPLKRTKSVTKLERSVKSPGSGLRGSRSHESLLSSHADISTIDLSEAESVSVATVHQSVLGRPHCFQVRGGPRGERYYSCGSRQERDLWIYSLRKSIQPNAEHYRHVDNSLKIWIYEAKGLPPKKKYFCEIYLDDALFGRTSTKLRSNLLFWGEYFDFPDVPEFKTIVVSVWRECEKKRKRDKHQLVGCVKIPLQEAIKKTYSEDWYPILLEKNNSLGRNSAKEVIPTLRIKCRFQRIEILPIRVYDEFLQYLKEHYKSLCDMLEPVIGVKAKEDIAHALVLLMHSQGMASTFLTDVVAMDLLRVGDQRLTFRGNSLATKSMEAFLKLTGEQYLHDTLAVPIAEIIADDRNCEVDPAKVTGAISRQQQILIESVRLVWDSIFDSSKNFPPQLKECFSTFRARLKILDRDDMADNLISASIFLRFFCPAILSPSLFNLTTELPPERAGRNLTLVAKTLQTLANFTRFQAKEDFMEFLNEFLDHEAPKMKEFLHKISCKDLGNEATDEASIFNWTGYIDQGKQLSNLHSLLLDNLTKLPSDRAPEVADLKQILKRISQAEEDSVSHCGRDESTTNPSSVLNPEELHQRSERGVIRGGLTAHSLDNNIFTYNDPTIGRQRLDVGSNANKVTSNLDRFVGHSRSTTSITSTPDFYHTEWDNQPLNGSTEGTPLVNRGSQRELDNKKGGNLPNSDFKMHTLPKNNAHKQRELKGDGGNLIQIGMDSNNAFVRKSPTPHWKSSQSGFGLRTNFSRYGGSIDSQSQAFDVNGNKKNRLSNQHPLQQISGEVSSFKMPMNLEDLDDLLNYADENQGAIFSPNEAESSSITQGRKSDPKEALTSKGINNSITPNVCSSVYHSLSTQTQGSSPLSSAGPWDNLSAKEKQTNRSSGNGPLKYQFGGTKATVNAVMRGNGDNISSRYGNPAMTPTSSEEQLSEQGSSSRSRGIGEIRGESELNMIAMSLGRPSKSNNSSKMNRHGTTSEWDPRSSQMYCSKNVGSTSGHPVDANQGAISSPMTGFKMGIKTSSSSYPRLSMESDSSSDTECTGDLSMISGGHSESQRQVSARSVEQYEKEIQRLQMSMDSMRRKLENFELRQSDNELDSSASTHSDSKMRSIISRLIAMEEELRREQLKMSLALTHKQKVIEAQGQQIAALDRANNRLLSALSNLRQRYENQNQSPSGHEV